MQPAPDVPWYRQVTRQQWKTFLTTFTAWTLDAFDFTILTFVLIDIQQSFSVNRALAGALVHEPQLIILDEPLTGLDAASARQVKRVLRERVAAGGTVIMTTHILEVAERMADRIGVIAAGRLIAEGTLDELHRQVGMQAGLHDTSLEDTFLALVAKEAVPEAVAA